MKTPSPSKPNPAKYPVLLSLLALCTTGHAAFTENFNSYPDGGSGWTTDWAQSTANAIVETTLSTDSPLNGGGSYLSVAQTSGAADMGVSRNIGTAAALPYTLTFDWRLDSDISNFSTYTDRIHIGATTETTAFGTNTNWTWFIGVVAADNPNPTPNGTPYYPMEWYFYKNSSSTTTGGFTQGNMARTGLLLEQNTVYSFTVNVDPASQTYSASISDNNGMSFSASDLNFRNQDLTTVTDTASTLVFGASTNTGDARTFSLDNINIPEPTSAALLAASGLLCLIRRRNS